jgi:biopolymer transport protein ExbB
MTAWQLFLSGGPLMWPILGCAVFALALALDRFFYLSAAEKGSREMLAAVLDKVKRNQIKEAVQFCEKSPCPVARILKAGVLKYDRPRSQIKEALDEAALYEIPRLERNLPLLATIAHITPLLGLLGTVAGMTSCFYAVYGSAASARAVSTAQLAGGIWQALITTCAGLSVAIPTFIAYNFLVSKVHEIVLEMEKASAELVNSLSE